MKRKLIITNDGSSSIFIPEMDETYHSSHGALQEAVHVFIKNGLNAIDKKEIAIFELGFGTGLNALLTLEASRNKEIQIDYTGIEAFPVEHELINSLNYTSLIAGDFENDFLKMHDISWDESHAIAKQFSLKKIHAKIQEVNIGVSQFDLIYFDAFGYRAQAEMWDVGIIQQMYDALKEGGVLVSYAARGQFKRDLKAVGFKIEALPGPPGKREMTRATKGSNQ
jgi:tRNA U34 5-methylaminomethyl-2-thiouridine-forming methyltransferase MnmC